nr:FAD-binding protein [Armatimonas sp.]
MESQRNWAGNLTYSAEWLHKPESIAQVQELVCQCRRLRALGTRHCFNAIADCPEDMLSTERLTKIVGLDRERQTVTIESGVRYGELASFLHAAGWSLPNLASLPHISVAGAVATATHGSGDGNGNLATSVIGMELVTASGEKVQLSQTTHGDDFFGMVVHLGALGVVTQLTLKIQPTFQIAQMAYANLPVEALKAHFDEITSSGYSVSLFTDWQSDFINQVWVKSKTGEVPETLFGAQKATQDRHPLPDHSAESCTTQCGIPGPWHERLPHFKLAFTPSSGAELQSEYFIGRENALAAFTAIAALRDKLAPHLMISEIRTIAADNLWLSPHYQRNSVAFHFTWHPHTEQVLALLPIIEEALAPFAPRPHWGKIFTMRHTHYPKLPDFLRLCQAFDPHGKFRNAFLETVFP